MRLGILWFGFVLLVMMATPSGAEENRQLLRLANEAYEAGDYEKCVEQYNAAVKQGVEQPGVFYDAACCCALNERIDQAYIYLEKAVESGYRNSHWLQNDTDLQSLHADDRWPTMVRKCEAAEEVYLQSINRELCRAFRADQADRSDDTIDWSFVQLRDSERRQLAMEMLDSGLVITSDDYFHAAMIFQHGDDSTDYKRAHELAVKAVELDSTNNTAKWLSAAAMDRYLWNIKKSQIYGTQYHMMDGVWTIEPIDTTAVTDEERRQWHVPPLAEARLKAARMNEQNKR